MNIEENLKNHRIKLEDASTPAGNYVPYVITNKLVFISGQLPFKQGKIPITGVVGETVSAEDAIEMARKTNSSTVGSTSFVRTTKY